MPRTRLSAQSRREQLLELAEQILARAGYQGLSILELAERGDISRAGVLHHFGSKEQLLIELLVERDRRDLLALDVGSGGIDVRDFLDRTVRRNLEQPEVVRLYTVLSAEALDPGHPAHAFFADRLEMAIGELAPLLTGFDRNGRGVAVEILSFLDGLQLNAFCDPTIDIWARWTSFADALFAQQRLPRRADGSALPKAP